MALCSMFICRSTSSHTGCIQILFHLKIIGDQYKLSAWWQTICLKQYYIVYFLTLIVYVDPLTQEYDLIRKF